MATTVNRIWKQKLKRSLKILQDVRQSQGTTNLSNTNITDCQYRAQVFLDGKGKPLWRVQHLVDQDSFHFTLQEGWFTEDELPQWMLERIAVLGMIKVEPPMSHIPGVGARINEDSYWIQAEEQDAFTYD